MIEWSLRAWRILPGEITCIIQGPCTELIVHLRNLQSTDPCEGIIQEKVCFEDIPGLPANPGD